MQSYDAIIIGSGQAGNPLAHKLADLGWQVALVEREYLGGTCINWGCTPTKTLIASAQVAREARRGAELGVHVDGVRVEFAAVMARKERIVQEWREGQQQHIAKRPTLTLYQGEARFVSPNEVEVADERLQSERIFINTGTRARIPTLKGDEGIEILTNKTILQLQALPAHLIILGGSYIGLEFGQMFRRFGSEVTVIEHNERIIPREDKEISLALQEILEGEGIRFMLGAEAKAVQQAADGTLTLTLTTPEGEQAIKGSHLLAAAGRTPNTDSLNLPAAGVETLPYGYVKTNERLETNVPGIWALGDVKGGPAFTHISYDDHLIVYENLVNGGQATIRERLVPYALFTDPQLGRVGMGEQEARAAGYEIKVGSIPMSYVARAIERGDTRGLMKVVIDAKTDRLLGAAILGSEGGELIHTLLVLMRANAPWTLLKQAIYIHPTLSEGFFSLFDTVR